MQCVKLNNKMSLSTIKIGKKQNSYKFPVIPDRISEIPGNSRREFWVLRFKVALEHAQGWPCVDTSIS